jgi:hypothetical protein
MCIRAIKHLDFLLYFQNDVGSLLLMESKKRLFSSLHSFQEYQRYFTPASISFLFRLPATFTLGSTVPITTFESCF